MGFKEESFNRKEYDLEVEDNETTVDIQENSLIECKRKRWFFLVLLSEIINAFLFYSFSIIKLMFFNCSITFFNMDYLEFCIDINLPTQVKLI